jgi:hypothetical protein
MNIWTAVKISTCCASVKISFPCKIISKDNPGCACGFECKNVIHFFLEYPINEHIRNTLFLILQIYGAIDIDIILHGNEILTEAQHVDIFTAVQMFISNTCSHRFDWLLQVLFSLVNEIGHKL